MRSFLESLDCHLVLFERFFRRGLSLFGKFLVGLFLCLLVCIGCMFQELRLLFLGLEVFCCRSLLLLCWLDRMG